MTAAGVRPRRWREAAACRGEDPEVFFPVAESGPVYEAQVAAAKEICARCTVRAECLGDALQRIPDGIAGGLTAQERRALRTSSAGAAPVTVLELGTRPGADPEQAETPRPASGDAEPAPTASGRDAA